MPPLNHRRATPRRLSPGIRPLLLSALERAGFLEKREQLNQIARGALLFLFCFVVFVPSLTTTTRRRVTGPFRFALPQAFE